MIRRFRPAAALALALAIPWVAGPVRADDRGDGKPAVRRTAFRYQASYASIPKSAASFDMWVPLPWADDHQEITNLVVQSPGGSMFTEETHGNRVYHGSSGPRGGVPFNIDVQFYVKRTAIPVVDPARPLASRPDAPEDLTRYMEPSSLVPIDGEAKSLARKVTKGIKDVHGRAKAIFDWVVSKIKLSQEGEGWGRGDFKYAVSTKTGNSLDLAAAFVGLARASQIPAREVLGFRLPPGREEGFLSGYHAWAEFWLPGFGWVPVDPAAAQENPSRVDRYFTGQDENVIRFSVGRDIKLLPPQRGEPLNYLLYPFAEAGGKPQGGSIYRFSFEPAPEPPPSQPIGTTS